MRDVDPEGIENRSVKKNAVAKWPAAGQHFQKTK